MGHCGTPQVVRCLDTRAALRTYRPAGSGVVRDARAQEHSLFEVATTMRAVFCLSVGLAVTAGASLASAQELAAPQVSTQQTGPAGNSGGGGEITSTSGPTDHSMVVGHLGLQYLGGTGVAALVNGGGTSTMGVPSVNLGSQTLQTLGVRYWLNANLGLDLGVSLGIGSGSTTTGTISQDNPSFFGFGLYGAVPIMIAESKHVSIHIDPFIQLAYGHSGITLGQGTATTDNSVNGLDFAVGGNAVAELQFGFLGIPQLALQARFGLALAYESTSGTQTMVNQNTSVTTTTSSLALGTTLGNYSPVDIITGSLGVVWYFGYTPGSSR